MLQVSADAGPPHSQHMDSPTLHHLSSPSAPPREAELPAPGTAITSVLSLDKQAPEAETENNSVFLGHSSISHKCCRKYNLSRQKGFLEPLYNFLLIRVMKQLCLLGACRNSHPVHAGCLQQAYDCSHMAAPLISDFKARVHFKSFSASSSERDWHRLQPQLHTARGISQQSTPASPRA